MIYIRNGINPPHVAALLRAWRERYQYLPSHVYRSVQKAAERIEDEQTTLEMELKRIRIRR